MKTMEMLDDYERETMSIEEILEIQEAINPYDYLPDECFEGKEKAKETSNENNFLYFNDGRIDLENLRCEKLPKSKITEKHISCSMNDFINANYPKKFMEFLSAQGFKN